MLNGERVTLRAVERRDLAHLARLENDLEIEILSGGDLAPISEARIEHSFEERLKEDKQLVFAIETEGVLIGTCGLFDFSPARSYRLGISIGERDYLGKGLGTEAVRLLVDYAFKQRNANRVWLEVLADNERAVRAYKKVGFIEEGRIRDSTFNDGRYRDEIVMSVLRSDWTPSTE